LAPEGRSSTSSGNVQLRMAGDLRKMNTRNAGRGIVVNQNKRKGKGKGKVVRKTILCVFISSAFPKLLRNQDSSSKETMFKILKHPLKQCSIYIWDYLGTTVKHA